MAYFYNNSNYYEVPDNYQYYQYYYNHDSSNYDPRYVHYYNTESHENAYQHAPTPPLVGYYYSNYSLPESLTSKNAVFHENNDYYNEPVSTEYVVYHNTINAEATDAEAEGSDVVFKEYNPKPFNGGYDINEQYGKPMSPNEKICYPKDKVDPNATSLGDFSYGAIPSPYVKEDKKVENVIEPKQAHDGVAPKEVIHEQDPSYFDDGEEDEDDYDDEDDYEDDEDDDVGEKKDDLGKEASKSAGVVAAAALGAGEGNKKEEQNVEGVAKPKDGGSAAGEVIQEKKAPDLEAVVRGEEEEDDDDEQYDDEEDDYGDEEGDFSDDNEGQEGKGEEKQGVLVNKEPPKTIPIAPLNDAPLGKEAPNIECEAKPKDGSTGGEVIIQEPKPSNFEREEEPIKGSSIDQGSKVEDQGNQVRRQIPPGYGMEALDICEGLFGGYFPCLWKKKQGNNINTNANTNVNQQSGYYENMSDYDYCCKETVDYLFGNPNPYGGTMPEKGSYGDPIYSYQRYHPQQPLSEQVEYYGGNSSLMQHGSRYYYGYSGDYYQ